LAGFGLAGEASTISETFQYPRLSGVESSAAGVAAEAAGAAAGAAAGVESSAAETTVFFPLKKAILSSAARAAADASSATASSTTVVVGATGGSEAALVGLVAELAFRNTSALISTNPKVIFTALYRVVPTSAAASLSFR